MYKLLTGDSTKLLSEIEAESVDLVITSPPYWNQRNYAHWETYYGYLASVSAWITEIWRILKPGRHAFWVIPDKIPVFRGRKGSGNADFFPVYADTERFAIDHGFICKFPIIWKKSHGTQKMFGSYPYPHNVIITPMTERICDWQKPGKTSVDKKRKEESAFTKEQWVKYAQDLWEIQAETGIDHPAPFPVEIPLRLITLFSYKGDLVLDPFVGSGSTGVACLKLGRDFIGIDINSDYLMLARKRLSEEEAWNELLEMVE